MSEKKRECKKTLEGKGEKRGEMNMSSALKSIELSELKKSMSELSKKIPILKSGKKGAIELDPNNPLHREWYEGR